MSRILSTHEVYFLVRVGTWGEAELEAWVQSRIDDLYASDDEEWDREWEDEDE